MARHSTRQVALNILLILVITLAGLPIVSAQSNRQIWARIPGVPATVDFADIAMLDTEHAWAVGAESAGTTLQGVVFRLRLQGGLWRAAPEARFPHPLRAISIVSAREVWAAGEQGLIIRRDVDGWKEARRGGGTINTIHMRSGTASGWAAGEVATSTASTGPFLLRYDEGQWTIDEAIRASSGGGINRLDFVGDQGWAVGNSRIWRYNGGYWEPETAARSCPTDGCAILLSGVSAVDDEHAWAVGFGAPRCDGCYNSAYVMRRTPAGWSLAHLPPLDQPQLQQDTMLGSVHFVDDKHGWVVGHAGFTDQQPLVLSYRDGIWSHDPVPSADSSLTAVTATDPRHALAVGSRGTILSYGYGLQPPEALETPSNPRCFPETGQCVDGRFRQFWESNGGLAVFGFPTTEARYEINRDMGHIYLTQWFERTRFEYHPKHAAPYDVLLGRLGDERLRQLEIDWRREPQADAPRTGCLWFEQTRHTVCDQTPDGGFKRYWEAHGLRDPLLSHFGRSLALFGLPLTEPRMETNSSGDTVLTQWFERARLEWHPDNPDQFKVLQGLLGNEVQPASLPRPMEQER